MRPMRACGVVPNNSPTLLYFIESISENTFPLALLTTIWLQININNRHMTDIKHISQMLYFTILFLFILPSSTNNLSPFLTFCYCYTKYSIRSLAFSIWSGISIPPKCRESISLIMLLPLCCSCLNHLIYIVKQFV